MFFLFITAIIPILWLMIALSKLKMPGFKACVIAFLLAVVLAVIVQKMPFIDAITAALEGGLIALWPICLVIIAALFTYNLTLETKAMEDIKGMLSTVSRDKRILMLIIGWGFGNFMEGMAGFGTAVAIPAGILMSLGLDPIRTVVACLVVNSTPTAFGSVGVPTVTLASVAGVDPTALSANVAVIQALLMFISPFFMVVIIGGSLKALKGVFGITLAATISFTVPNYLMARYIGPELPDILGSICCMICLTLYALFFYKNSEDKTYMVETMSESAAKRITLPQAVKAWSPFVLIFILLLITSKVIPQINKPLSTIKSSIQVYTGPGAKKLGFTWINTPGIMIFIAAAIGGLIQGASLGRQLKVLNKTLKSNWKTIVTISSVVAAAKVMDYSGMVANIAAFLVAVTGSYFPLISPLIGVIGAFVTGSGTSTNVLFGSLQAQTASAIGASPEWLAAANGLGAGIGKMICPQGIAIGAAAVNAVGSESTILAKAVKYCIIYFIIGGLVCYFVPQLGLLPT